MKAFFAWFGGRPDRRPAGRPGERDAYMGAEGCSASARAFQGVRFHWPHTIRVYFVLSPKFLGTCYWCAIKIFVLFFAVSAGRRKRQKTKPGPAPTGPASAIVVRVDYFRVLWLASAIFIRVDYFRVLWSASAIFIRASRKC